jgi:hypothetical protein
MSQAPHTGVSATHETTLGISTAGRPVSGSATYTIIPEIEGCTVSINGVVQKWSAMDKAGWESALRTGCGLTFSITAKRVYGDTAHEYIASKALKTGTDCNSVCKLTFPNLDYIEIPCVLDVKKFGGNTTEVDALEFDILSDGQPTYTEYSA